MRLKYTRMHTHERKQVHEHTQRLNKNATLRKHSYRRFLLMDSQFIYDQNKELKKRKRLVSTPLKSRD